MSLLSEGVVRAPKIFEQRIDVVPVRGHAVGEAHHRTKFGLHVARDPALKGRSFAIQDLFRRGHLRFVTDQAKKRPGAAQVGTDLDRAQRSERRKLLADPV